MATQSHLASRSGWSLRLSAAALALLLAVPAVAGDVPAKKQSSAGLYLTAVEAGDLLADHSVVFIDVRTRAEVAFLGLPKRADVNIPYMVMPVMANYDGGKKEYMLELNPDFSRVFEAYVTSHGLSKDTRFVLICRSGSRSAKAASLLYELGYKNAYSVIDGYEGDKAKKGDMAGQRVVNGWRNAGLAWSYKLEPSQVYPDDQG